ncbi:unnamed protein product [Lactuca virosa]|uniref:Uncharacterized protein n=1 Tax=Lactuca virosa TaxID=75947 RepID=A0AAU9LQJ1_9ASTR|nr:unnamed protein product [Lactuca virosa]
MVNEPVISSKKWIQCTLLIRCSIKKLSESIDYYQEIENATWMLTVFSCFGQYLCLHFESRVKFSSPKIKGQLQFWMCLGN